MLYTPLTALRNRVVVGNNKHKNFLSSQSSRKLLFPLKTELDTVQIHDVFANSTPAIEWFLYSCFLLVKAHLCNIKQKNAVANTKLLTIVQKLRDIPKTRSSTLLKLATQLLEISITDNQTKQNLMDSAIKLLLIRDGANQGCDANGTEIDYAINKQYFDENCMKVVFELTLRVVNAFKNTKGSNSGTYNQTIVKECSSQEAFNPEYICLLINAVLKYADVTHITRASLHSYVMMLFENEADLCVDDDEGKFFNCLNGCVLDHGAMDNDYTIRCLSMKTFAMSFVGNSDENKVFMYEDFVEQFSDVIENMNATLLETQSLAYGFKCIVTTYPEKMDEVLSLFLKMSAAKRISDPFAAYLFRSIAFATGIALCMI